MCTTTHNRNTPLVKWAALCSSGCFVWCASAQAPLMKPSVESLSTPPTAPLFLRPADRTPLEATIWTTLYNTDDLNQLAAQSRAPGCQTSPLPLSQCADTLMGPDHTQDPNAWLSARDVAVGVQRRFVFRSFRSLLGPNSRLSQLLFEGKVDFDFRPASFLNRLVADAPEPIRPIYTVLYANVPQAQSRPMVASLSGSSSARGAEGAYVWQQSATIVESWPSSPGALPFPSHLAPPSESPLENIRRTMGWSETPFQSLKGGFQRQASPEGGIGKIQFNIHEGNHIITWEMDDIFSVNAFDSSVWTFRLPMGAWTPWYQVRSDWQGPAAGLRRDLIWTSASEDTVEKGSLEFFYDFTSQSSLAKAQFPM